MCTLPLSVGGWVGRGGVGGICTFPVSVCESVFVRVSQNVYM